MDTLNQNDTVAKEDETVRPENEEPDQKTESEPEIELDVSTDRMMAELRVKPASPDQEVTSDFILDFLKKNRIVYGILRDDIEKFCKEKRFYTELVCAQGLEPVDEDDAEIEFFFRTNQEVIPKQKEDGTVDFHELGLVQNVSKGDVLCRIKMPEKGRDGNDIYNHKVAYKKARIPPFPSGSNTVVSEDRLTLSAAIDGCIEYKKSVLNVNSVFVVRGDVCSASGNIDFLGSVTIQGDVREGFTVKAGKDISVRGMVEGADLESGGNITIANGMKGMESGKLRAKGNIAGRYFENVSLECGGDVYADVLMNSTINAGGSVFLRGKKALLIGGRVKAGHQIYTGYIGSDSNVHTEVVIESEQLQTLLLEESENPDALEVQLKSAQEQDNDLKNRIGEYTREISRKKTEAERIRPLLKTLIVQKSRNMETIRLLKEKVKKAREKQASYMDFKVTGVHTIYAGTTITIGSFTEFLVNDYSYTKFYSDRECIENAPLLPSDVQSY